MNVWIALETIVATSNSQSKINQVINTLTPFLLYNLIPSIMNDVTKELLRWNIDKVMEILRKLPISGDVDNIKKVAALLTIEEYEKLLMELLKDMDNLPLFRNRLFCINRNFKNAKKIRIFLEEQEKKIKWNIRRIYRARNLIVHVGRLTNESDVLLENAHNFLDNFLYQTLKFVEVNHITTIEQGIKEMALIWQHHKKKLHDREMDVCKLETYQSLLFGDF